MKIKKAGEYMQKIGADFMFTGEVLGQRPMSQHKRAMQMIAVESGFPEYLLRPLSAAHFEPTVPEREGWVDRNKLLAITGRSRKTQISLAAEKGIRDYPCPAGGCLLTDKNFSDRMRDYFAFTKHASIKDIPLLKVGRHFRLDSGDKVIVARNKNESKILKHLCRENNHLLFPFDFKGPTVILQGTSLEAAVKKMLRYISRPVHTTSRLTHMYMGKNEILSLNKIRNNDK